MSAPPMPMESRSMPVSELELTLSGRKLRDMDMFSKSDPMVVVWMKNTILDTWCSIGRTEVMRNNLNPDFSTKFVVEYRFEQLQPMRFDVYDIDSSNLENLEEHDFIGSCSVNLGEIVSAGRTTLTLRAGSDIQDCGFLLVSAEELQTNRDDVTLEFGASDLRSAWWKRFKPFLEAHKVDESCRHTLVYRSEVDAWTKNPSWKPTTIEVRSLCGGDLDRSIRFRCLNEGLSGESQLIGETFLTFRQLAMGDMSAFPLMKPMKDTPRGNLIIKSCSIRKRYSFLEYVLGGMQMHCIIAIDFTASNGHPHAPESLHFINNNALNQYEQAIVAVVPILEDYSSDKIFPVFGFGAKIPPLKNVSHDFTISAACHSTQEVLAAYRQFISQVVLCGPTNFAPMIKRAALQAGLHQDGSKYFILLILTDGVITDMFQTKEAIVRASTLPLSIIIVGVGGADFNAMSELDADDEPLSVMGVTAARDIVQFVPFREFQKLQMNASARLYLAEEVLAEIPTQVVSFMQSRSYAPRKQIAVPSTSQCPNEPPPPYSEI